MTKFKTTDTFKTLTSFTTRNRAKGHSCADLGKVEKKQDYKYVYSNTYTRGMTYDKIFFFYNLF